MDSVDENDKVCQWLVTGQWFSPVSFTNKTDCHRITEILLKVALTPQDQTVGEKMNSISGSLE